jgi:hypothetical protein
MLSRHTTCLARATRWWCAACRTLTFNAGPGERALPGPLVVAILPIVPATTHPTTFRGPTPQPLPVSQSHAPASARCPLDTRPTWREQLAGGALRAALSPVPVDPGECALPVLLAVAILPLVPATTPPTTRSRPPQQTPVSHRHTQARARMPSRHTPSRHSPCRAAATRWWCAACRTLTCARRARSPCPARASCRRTTRPCRCRHYHT